MCNARTSSNDQTPVPRIARGGRIWINLFGRDWIVRRRKPTTLGIIGAALGATGVSGLAWSSFNSFRPDLIGIMLVVVGAVVICYKRLETKNLAADEIYNVGRERGEADGYEQGYRDRGLEQPFTPVVVPLPQRCEHCGHSVGLTAVGSVADRV